MATRIGHLQFDTPFCQAGLAGYSDRAMRLVARRRGCPYAVTEALLDTIMLSGGMGLKKSIDINDEDHPVAGQIIGSEADTMSRAALILANAGYDVIDLNFACPVKKIKNKARGGHMLRDVPRGIDILKAVRDAVPAKVPTTVSLRRGFDDSPQSVDLFHQIIETAWSLGYDAVRVHGRTVEQKYLGPSRWTFLRELKAKYPDRTILGSGDVFTGEDAVRMLRETGVDVVWIARGAIGNPWIFQHARQLLPLPPGEGGGEGRRSSLPSTLQSGPTPAPALTLTLSRRERGPTLEPPSIHTQRDALAEHFSIAMEIHGEQLAGRRMRKMGIKYARFHPQASSVKTDFINVRSLREWNNVLDRWYSAEGPGIWPDPRAADEVNSDALEACAS
ncbi:MAG TPA: tRNA-dihydrouridine synthase family protein [Tepidisphaeraceae bacterium]